MKWTRRELIGVVIFSNIYHSLPSRGIVVFGQRPMNEGTNRFDNISRAFPFALATCECKRRMELFTLDDLLVLSTEWQKGKQKAEFLHNQERLAPQLTLTLRKMVNWRNWRFEWRQTDDDVMISFRLSRSLYRCEIVWTFISRISFPRSAADASTSHTVLSLSLSSQWMIKKLDLVDIAHHKFTWGWRQCCLLPSRDNGFVKLD